jgi:hypothetical protein
LETFKVKSEASQLKGHGAMKKLMLQRSEKTKRPSVNLVYDRQLDMQPRRRMAVGTHLHEKSYSPSA